MRRQVALLWAGAILLATILPPSVSSFLSPGDSWSSGAPLPTPRKGPGAVALLGKVYVFGDADMKGRADVYDIAADRWYGLPPLPSPRWSPGVAEVNGDIYVVSGGDYPPTKAFPEVWNYRLTGSYLNVTPIPTPRFQSAAVGLGGKLYVIGGSDRTDWMSTVEVYEPGKGWSQGVAMPTARAAAAAAVVGGKIYVTGGRDRASNTFATVEVYDPASSSWSSVPDMPTPRRGHGTAGLNGKLYVFGGCNGALRGDDARPLGPALPSTPHDDEFLCGRYLVENEEFDLATGKWSPRSPLPGPRAYFGYAATAEAAYALGGEGNVTGAETATYSPPSGPTLDRAAIDPSSASLEAGASVLLTARALDLSGSDIAGATFSWSVSGSAGDLSGATGRTVTFSAKGPGSATVKLVASFSGISKEATSQITVIESKIAIVVVTPTTLELEVAGVAPLSAEARDASGAALAATLAWSTAPEGVVSVSPASGSVTSARGLSVGSATVSVMASYGNSTGNAEMTVVVKAATNALPPLARVTSPQEGAKVSGAFALKGTASPGAGGPAVEKVEIRSDGGAWIAAAGTGAWSSSIDPKSLAWAAGAHRLDARAFDGSGFSPLATVNVSFGPADGAGEGNATSRPRGLPSPGTLESLLTVAGAAAVYAAVHLGRPGAPLRLSSRGTRLRP